jgi:hypothetical protein
MMFVFFGFETDRKKSVSDPNVHGTRFMITNGQEQEHMHHVNGGKKENHSRDALRVNS